MFGRTFSIKRMQTHDGPGLRTTVFMKGCSLNCAWCHNPESISSDAEVWRIEQKCIGCRQCEYLGQLTDHSNWNGDFGMIENCSAKALESLRKDWEVVDLLKELERDSDFWGEEGGVTFSGGEPLLQWEYLSHIIPECKKRGWNVALDTCGHGSMRSVEALIPQTDVVLYDVKLLNSSSHQKWTGFGNDKILRNLRYIASQVKETQALTLWLRTPLIPNATDSVRNIEEIGAFIQNELNDCVSRWELCSFNNLCSEKYHRMQKTWSFEGETLLKKSHANDLFETAGKYHENVILKGRFIH